ncbi:hypothetical protein [Curtobacterium sp. UCD-KPL2560]|uniref:hypothetical protein n=1 Tax=Curtobacterium sp. UCD-KPL2560 TaxID=1885315 RepID=UPI00082410DE|nr:hypothetical protein [Curtobacterium sp. UCD-KPL2560]
MTGTHGDGAPGDGQLDDGQLGDGQQRSAQRRRGSRRAARVAGPVTPGTDQLVGTWTRADDATAAAPPVPGAAGGPQADDATEAAPPVPDAADGPQVDGRPGGATRPRRRVTTQPVPGSDPAPAPEPPRHRAGENDDQLLRDVPPHW